MGMKNNIGAADSRIRIGGGLGLAAVGVASLGGLLGVGTVVGTVLALLGLVLAGTGLVRVCLLYRLLGVDTSGSR
ncbi:YgaP-like transmembrane domain (plasmid) [Halobacterium sp. NMX12-1]|uniref:YgaP-like transmembrane domain n=1 Tax=Halobacterium sp. NMX12-1 TaxID=3166650 RepID=A0AAU8C8H9_9EURY|nr:YgaP-like transmembrane domain [Halomicroarcula sp. GDY20]